MINNQQIIDDAWLGISVDESQLFNPMDFVVGDEDKEHLIERIAWLMMRPEYFSFACKHIMNIELSPFQALILAEVWNRKFPMLIGSRGLGKLLRPNEKIRVKNGWKTMENIVVGDKVYGSDGKLCNVIHKTDLQKNVKMYKITLRDGRTIDCCEDHMWKVWSKNKNRGEEVVWSELKTKDMAQNFFWVRKDSKSKVPKLTKEYRYALPVNMPLVDEEESDLPIHPYVVGVLLGDGTLTGKQIVLTSLDQDLIERFESFLPEGYKLSQSSEGKDYRIIRKSKDIPAFHHLCKEAGIWGHNSHTKFIPEKYRFSSYAQKLELIKGLMDTDGYSSKSTIEYYTVSDALCSDFIEVLRSLGISCRRAIKQSWFNKKRYADCHRVRVYTDKPVFSIERKLSYLSHVKSKAGQSKYEKVFITNIEQIENGDGYCIQVDSPDKTYITKDYIVTHNSFLLSVYALLRALFMPRRKIIIVGAAFRQSKVIFEYMDTIWKNAPVLRDLCGNNSGPRRDVDRCVMYINDSIITALPLGDGQKIRGQRAHDIISDEFACLKAGSLVETTNGLIRIENFDTAYNSELITGDASLNYEKPEKFIKTPLTEVYEIKLQNGYVIRCSENHKIMTQNGWKTPLELSDKDWIEKSMNSCFGSNTNGLNEDLCWLMGLLVSEGSIVDKKRISISTTDMDLVNRIVSKFNWKVSTKSNYIDSRYGWKCKESYTVYTDDENLRNLLFNLGLDYSTSHNKTIPESILTAPKNYILAFLSGLFDGDGSCFLWKDREIKNCIGLAYYSVSERLCRDVQIIMNKLGYDGYINKRKSKISNNDQWFVRWNNNIAKKAAIELNVPRFIYTINQCVVPEEPQYISYDKSRGKWKVQIKYCDKKIQKRFIEKQEALDYLASIKSQTQYRKVLEVKKLDNKEHLYDYYLPVTNSFYAECHRQHNSIPRDIFENVVAGFAAVSSSPIEKVKQKARDKKAKELGINLSENLSEEIEKSNQIVLSGTAYYDFNHFADYWKRYKAIINSKGDPNLLKEVFGEEPSPSFDWREYSIIRIPVDKLPEGFMDEGQISRAKATIHSGIYNMEYSACFTTDSQGFFKRSLLEACTCSQLKPVKLPSGDVHFGAMLRGDPKKKYIFGVDPASEVDNFSIVVIELNEDHRRIVHSWTTTRQQHKNQVKSKIVDEDDFYSYCAKKIRSLMRVFPCVEIAIDTQGGGIAVIEALHDKDKMQRDEVALWPIIDEDKPKDTDDNNGLHILRLCQFARADWLAEANHGMRKDFEDKVLLFPFFDSASIGVSIEEDKAAKRVYDTLEDCVMEIEELKDELSMIVMTQTGTGRERWDTPEIKVGTGKKSRLRKDRYSSLLMANMSARSFVVNKNIVEYGTIGGFARSDNNSRFKNEKLFYGPNWFTEKMQDVY